MRSLVIVLVSVVVAFFMTLNAGCAAPATPAKVPEPIAYDRADYMPPSEFDMKIDTSGSTFDRPAVKAPPVVGTAPRLVSLEKNGSGGGGSEDGR